MNSVEAVLLLRKPLEDKARLLEYVVSSEAEALVAIHLYRPDVEPEAQRSYDKAVAELLGVYRRLEELPI